MGTLADYIIAQLAAWGVRRVYGVVGDTLFVLLDALARRPEVRFVAVRHEAAAAFMAAAEAKLTGGLAVCLATSGPGIANLLGGLGDAHSDRVPLLALSGQVATGEIGTGAKQYVDQQTLVQPLVGYTALLSHPDAAGSVLPAALRRALGQGRPTHIALPKDLLAQPCSAPITWPEPFLRAAPAPGPAVIDGALQRMAAAERPLLLIGQGARAAGAAVLELAERWGAGIVQTLPAKGAVPGTHPLVLGGLGDGGADAAHTALHEADLLLCVGATWWPRRYVPAELPVIKVDRRPEQIGGAMAVVYGLAGDAQSVLVRLAAGLAPAARPQWRERLGGLRRDWLARLAAETEPGDGPLPPQHIVRALEQALPADAVISLDTGDHTVWFGRAFSGERHTVLVSGWWRSLGCGLPGALAAALAVPERRAVALVGDGSLQSLLGELVTAAELALPVTVVVVNNKVMAIEHNRATARGYRPLGAAPAGPDFAAVARACGLAGRRAENATELAAALKSALAGSAPVLIDVSAANPPAPTIGG